MSTYRKLLDVAGMSLENLLDNLFYAGLRSGEATLPAFHSHDVDTGRAARADLEYQEQNRRALMAEVLKRFEAKGESQIVRLGGVPAPRGPVKSEPWDARVEVDGVVPYPRRFIVTGPATRTVVFLPEAEKGGAG